MKKIFCKICKKVAIKVKEHVLSRDFLENIDEIVGKNQCFRFHCRIQILEKSCRDSLMIYIRIVKKYSGT